MGLCTGKYINNSSNLLNSQLLFIEDTSNGRSSHPGWPPTRQGRDEKRQLRLGRQRIR